MKKILIIMFVITMIIPLVSSSLGTFKQNECVSIRVLANCSNVNLTEVSNNNETFIINQPMTNLGGQTFNYTFCNTSKIDTYTYSWNNYCVDCSNNDCGNSFDITKNGREQATGGVIVLFVIIFLILVLFTCYLSLYSIGHLLNKDFDLVDLSMDWGLFFVILAVFFLQDYYLGNEAITTYLLWFMSAGGILLILIPIIAFILSIASGSFKQGGYRFRIPKR